MVIRRQCKHSTQNTCNRHDEVDYATLLQHEVVTATSLDKMTSLPSHVGLLYIHILHDLCEFVASTL